MSNTTFSSEWKSARLGDYCHKPDYGYTASATQEVTGIRFLRITDIQEGGVKWDTVPYCVCDEKTVRSNRLLRGDVVIARIGATTGKAYLIDECPETVFASYLMRVRTQPALHADFLYAFFQTEQYWKQIDENKGGRLKGGVSIPVLQNLILPLPPLAEQRAIAAALRAVQDARDARRRALILERERKAALMEDLFTYGIRGESCHQTEIGMMPHSWEMVPFGSVITLAQYGLSIRGETTGQYPILRMNCLKEGKVLFRDLQYVNLPPDQFQAFRLKYGDLLFNRTNSQDLVGKTGVFEADTDCVCASYLVRVRVDTERASPTFLNYYLNYLPTLTRLRAMASRGVSQANINASKLKTLAVPLPLLDEQQDIADTLTACDQKIAALEAEATLHDELFRALLEELMAGRISTWPLVEGVFARA
ncbi:MAG: Type restriction-modification system specificity subunit [Chthonomonadaceae bacterium]|nr:Type restriction-modification system specificity subunit [Chthonomonadaceae bacterium]